MDRSSIFLAVGFVEKRCFVKMIEKGHIKLKKKYFQYQGYCYCQEFD